MMKRSKQRGMTIVELVITIVIISIALIAVVNAFSTTAGRSADPLWEYKTLKLAQLYFDEILSKPYDESTPLGGVPTPDLASCPSLGPEAGENRETYDDVDDYVMTNEEPNIISATGISIDDTYKDYRITIEVECAGDELGLAREANAKRISIEITPPPEVTNASTMRFSAYRGNF